MNLYQYEVEQLRKENDLLKTKIENLQERLHKSKRHMEFNDMGEYWHIFHYSKDFKGALFNEVNISVSKEDVEVLWKVIKSLGVEKTNKAEVVTKLIQELNLSFKDHMEFSGNRKEYFGMYYYPLVILDHLEYVNYKRAIEVLK